MGSPRDKRPRGRRAGARTASKGVKVTAVKTTAGPSATSVNVELEPEELKGEVGEFAEVKGVSARIPEAGASGRVRWREQPLQAAGTSEEEAEGRRRRRIQRYLHVHYGPSAAEELGVSVKVETDRGTIKAPSAGHAYGVKDDSQPGESPIKKKPRRG